MDKIFKVSLVFLGLIFGHCSFANGVSFSNYYIGLDGGFANYPLAGKEELFKKEHPKINLFAGVKFNEYFGVEIGAESALTKRKAKLKHGDMTLGHAVGINTDNKSKSRVSGFYASLQAAYSFSGKFCLLGSAGIKKANASIARDAYDANTGLHLSTRKISQSKLLARLSGGAQYELADNLALRGMLTWENSSKLKKSIVDGPNTYSANFKNSFHYTLGVVYQI